MDFNIAFGTILIIVLVIFPGVVFKRFFYQSAFSKQLFADEFADRIISSSFWGLIIQLFTIVFFMKTTSVQFKATQKKLNEYYKLISDNKLPSFVDSDLNYFLIYIGVSFFISIILGLFIFYTIRLLRLDLKYTIFRFYNNWHYYFKGEIIKTSDFNNHSIDFKEKSFLSAEVDLVLSTPGKDGKQTLVKGTLTQYSLNRKTGDLEFLYLTLPMRYKNDINDFRAIPSDCFIVPFNKVENMNIRYFYIRKEREKFLVYVIVLMFLILTILNFIYPWFANNLTILRIILAIINGFLFLIFLTGFLLRIFNPYRIENGVEIRNNLTLKETSIFILSILLLGSSLLKIYKLNINQIINFVIDLYFIYV